mgnify:CR=1 FL=1
MKELIEIQKNLNAPKNQHNAFGGYYYRSCEDILAAVKPLLYQQQVSLTLTDSILNVCDRFYVMATATLKNSTGETECVTAYAREEISKKGMDASQITGASSSYARKYALNGLFAIDDQRDADALNTQSDFTSPSTLAQALTSIISANNLEQLKEIYVAYPDLAKENKFISALTKRRKELNV